jgi:hypothetical protein
MLNVGITSGSALNSWAAHNELPAGAVITAEDSDASSSV